MGKFRGKCGQELDKKKKLCPQCDQTVLSKKKKRKKTAIVIVAVLCCIGIIGVGIFGVLRFVNNDSVSYTYDEYNSFMEGFTDVLIIDEESAIEAVASVGDVLGIKDAKTELKVVSVNYVGSDCYYKLQQYYNDVEVYGNTISLVADKDGKALGMTSVFESVHDTIDMNAKITDEEIVSSVNKYLGIDTLSINDIKENKLVIYKNESSKYVLANNLLIDGYGEFVLDTKTSEVLLFNDLVNPVAAVVESKNKSAQAMGWKNDDGSHHLYNDQYKISVFDFDGIDSYPQNMDYKTNYKDHGIDTIYSNNNVFEDEEAVRLLDQLIKISDFYKKLGFEGFDRIHAGINDGHQNGDNSLGCGGVENGVRFATIAMGECYNSSYYDVVAHEYTHGVTGLITNWSVGTSGSEAGAICEAYSDIFGVLIENIDSPDWTLGKEDMYRDIASPISSYPSPGYTRVEEMKEGSKESHTCSTIISHCAYLMYHGIDNNEDLKIEGNKLAELFYRCLYMLSKNSTFSQCRSAVELSARIMCINGDMDENEYLCVRAAFAQAGISPGPYTYSKTLKNQFTLSVLNSQNTENVSFNLKIYQRKNSSFDLFGIGFGIPYTGLHEVYNRNHTNGNIDLDLENGIYYFYITEDSSNSETIITRVVVSGQNDKATDEVVVYTDFLPITTIILNEETIAPSESSKELPEKDLKAIAENRGTVSVWGYADYDGNDTSEAFAVITDENSNILKTIFVSSHGDVKTMEDDLNFAVYKSEEGCVRYKDGKGFFWADMGAHGSGYSTIVYSVKNNAPYILQMSSDIQGFYQKDDMFYTTKNEFLSGGGHAYPKYELIYDSNTQEFSVGERIDESVKEKSNDNFENTADKESSIVGVWGRKGSTNAEYEFTLDGVCYWQDQKDKPGTYEILDDNTLVVTFSWTKNTYTFTDETFDEFREHSDGYFWYFENDVLTINGSKYYRNGKEPLNTNKLGDLTSILEGSWVAKGNTYEYIFYSDGTYEENTIIVSSSTVIHRSELSAGQIDISSKTSARLYQDTKDDFGSIQSYSELMYYPESDTISIGGSNNVFYRATYNN